MADLANFQPPESAAPARLPASAQSPRQVRVAYRKYDGSLHWHEHRYVLGQDAHGLWLGAGPGTRSQRGHEPPVVFPDPSVLLIPTRGWWTAVFNDQPAPITVYCDIATQAEVGDQLVSAIDLDLDVVRRRTGECFIDDEDEFADHQVRMAYPQEVIAAARSTADWLLGQVQVAAEPFGSAYQPYLARARTLP